MIETAPSALPTQEDYRRYDRVWQRVSPSLDPYPAVRAAEEPCCAAPDAPEGAEAVRGFLRDALADAQTYRCLARLAPTGEGRRLMCRLAADAAARVRTLQAAYFLLTGEVYAVTVVLPPQPRLPWRDRLRERYRAEVCGAAAYARAAEPAADVCLQKTFLALSEAAYRRAAAVRRLVERGISHLI